MASKDKKDFGVKQVTQLEHVLLRPNSYVGSVLPSDTDALLLHKGKIISKNIKISHALVKIFDEIIVNCRDQYIRCIGTKEPVTDIQVTFDASSGVIGISNNGTGVPVAKHSSGKYIPRMIFAELMTSQNYDDTERRITSGTNGYGSKLTNIFSKRFSIVCIDTKHKKKYTQTWYDNMSRFDEPVITDCAQPGYTYVEFLPDYARFGMTDKDIKSQDLLEVFMRRAYDIAACIGPTCAVHFNGTKIPISSMAEYTQLIIGKSPYIALQKSRWSVVVAKSRDETFEQVSFVNGIHTVYGGTHVDYIANQIIDYLKTKLEKDPDLKGGKNIKTSDIKKYLMVVVAADIENPEFDSQSKEILKTPPDRFGSTFVLNKATLDQIDSELGLLEMIRNILLSKTLKDMTKGNASKKGRVTGIVKLEDANKAGTKDSHLCKLILTEGDSAAGMSRAGLSVVGRDYYGIFPLKGKIMNVRDKSTKIVAENEEIQNIIKILGLRMDMANKYDKDDNIKTLRYGSVILMTDSDTDKLYCPKTFKLHLIK